MPAQTHRAFGPLWFATHQRRLLGALNHPVLGRLLKRALRIRRCDLGYALPIVAISPHSYTVLRDRRRRKDGRWELTLTTDFRTHWKYSTRVYHAGKVIWWALHAWDQCVANPLVPAWNAGFDTFIVHPDPDPEVTTVDGSVSRALVDESWATLIAGAGNGVDVSATSGGLNIASTATTDQWATLGRHMYLFDTRPLGQGAVIQAATLSLFGVSKFDNLSISPNYNIYSANPLTDTNLEIADFQRFGVLPFSTAITHAGWSTVAYNDFVLNVDGRANLRPRGISKFAMRNANYDVAAVEPSWSSAASSVVVLNFADASGRANDPKLDVTYTIITWLPPQSDAGGPLIEVVPSGFGPPDFPEA